LYLVALIYLLVNPTIIFSQTTTTNGDITTTTYDYGNFKLIIRDSLDIEEEIQKHLDQYVDAQPPTGILIDRAIRFADIEKYTGKGEISLSTNSLYDQVLSELKQGGLIMPESLVAPQDCPIDNVYEYEKIELRLLIALYNRLDPDGHYDEEEVGLFTSKRRLLFNGSNTVFILRAADVTFSHPDISTNSVIQIDFGDGLGFRNVLIGSNINVRYTTTGKKTIKVKVIGDNNNIFDMKCEVIVEALNYPPHHSFILTSDDSYKGQNNSAIITHFSPLTFNGTSNNPQDALSKTKKPIIFVEGLDPENKNTAGAIYYEYLNQNNLAECLLRNNYDIFIVDFCQNTDLIQNNAMVMVEILRKINGTYKITKNANIVIGASMGGLISKYALSYMENKNEAHETSTFITIDTPHRGANIPLGLQEFMRHFKKVGDAKKWYNIIRKPAPKQMLYYHVDDKPWWAENQLRTDLKNEFASLGHPQKCRTVAISNGNPNRINQGFSPSSLILDFYIDYKLGGWFPWPDPFAKIWALPSQNSGRHKIGEFLYPKIYHRRWVYVGGTYPYDNAPGGWRATIGGMVEKFEEDSDYHIRHYKPNHCFIPTISSLDLDVEDPFYNIAADDNIMDKTPFDQIYYPNTNQKHVRIEDQMVNWLADEITRANIILDDNTWNYGEQKATKSIRLLPGFQSDDVHLSIEPGLDCNQ